MARMHYLKFYPESWIAESSLRLCSLAARGLWIELICRMAQSPEHGVLLSPGGKPVRDDQIPALVGGPHDGVMAALAELGSEGVLSRRTPDGAIYSRRMVRDHAEYVRQAESGSVGGKRSVGLKGTLKAPLKGSLESDPKASVDSRFSLLDSNSSEGGLGETNSAARFLAERRITTGQLSPGFVRFVELYPAHRSRSRDEMLIAWESMQCEPMADQIIAGLRAHMEGKDFADGVIPTAQRFLRERWWQVAPPEFGDDGRVKQAKPVKVDPHAADRALAAKWYLTLNNDQRREASGVVNIDQWADIARKGVVSDPILASWRASKSTGDVPA